jgi:uncharacterized membrane protein
MLVAGAAFADWIVAVHIVAVLVAFGAVFAYPVIALVVERRGRQLMPFAHRLQQEIGRRLINPGLLVVLIAGIYLASDLHDWKRFFVQWGLGVSIVIGALEGGFMIPREGRLVELAERDVAAAAGGEVRWSEEYLRLRNQVAAVGVLLVALVVATIFVMTVGAAG